MTVAPATGGIFQRPALREPVSKYCERRRLYETGVAASGPNSADGGPIGVSIASTAMRVPLAGHQTHPPRGNTRAQEVALPDSSVVVGAVAPGAISAWR